MELKLFFSWQTETELQGLDNKTFLIKAINRSIKNVEDKGRLKGVRIKMIEGLRYVSGTPDVAYEMFRQIDECDIFVGDVTIVQKMSKILDRIRNKHFLYTRYSPNCNVYGEYNRALGIHSKFDEQIILLMNDVNKSAKEVASEIPFDTRGRRWPIEFHLLPNSTIKETEEELKKLQSCLEKAISECALASLENKKTKYSPFELWYAQKKSGLYKGVLVDERIISKYQSKITKEDGVLVLVGPHGEEMSKLVMDSFGKTSRVNNYLFINSNCYKFDEYKNKLIELFQNCPDFVIVIDKCENIDDLLYLMRMHNAHNRMIIISDKEDVSISLQFYKYEKENLNKDFDEVLNELFHSVGVETEYQHKIKQYCDNNHSMIVKTMKGYRKDIDWLTIYLGDNGDGSIERHVLYVLSLFDCIGWTEEMQNQLEFLMTNDSFACGFEYENLYDKAKEVIFSYIDQGVIVSKGRTVTISSKRLSFELFSHWLETINSSLFSTMLVAIYQSKLREFLFKEMFDQLNFYKEFKEDVLFFRNMIPDLLNKCSIFNEFNALNTKGVSMLVNVFADYNPKAFLLYIERVFAKDDNLKNLGIGSFYIVDSLVKLSRTDEFFEKSTTLLLRIALKENDLFFDSAKDNFCKIFIGLAPVKSAKSSMRLSFLKKNIQDETQKSIIVSAVNRALSFNGLFTEDELDKNNMDSVGDEHRGYISGCLNILQNEIVEDSSVANDCMEILLNKFIVLCEMNYSDEVLSCIETVADHKNYDWDAMEEKLHRNERSLQVPQAVKKRIKNLADKLMKKDFVSRYKRIPQYYGEGKLSRCDFEEVMKERNAQYVSLAEEILRDNALDSCLEGILLEKHHMSDSFGERLSSLMDDDAKIQFVSKCVNVLKNNPEACVDVVCAFLKNIDKNLFERRMWEIIFISNHSTLIFSVLGIRCVFPSELYFSQLFQMLDDGRAVPNDFLYYWSKIRIGDIPEEDLIVMFSRLVNYQDGLLTVAKMARVLLYNNKSSAICDLLDDAFCKEQNNDILFEFNSLWIVGELLKLGNRSSLAKTVNRNLINYVSQTETLFNPSYEVEEIYRILMISYFDDIWPSLSDALLSDNGMACYNLKQFLGVNMVYDRRPIILEGNHFEKMLEWCFANIDKAPRRLAGLIYVIEQGENFSKEAMCLIDNFADKDGVLDELQCTINSFCCSGSAVPIYEKRKSLYSKLLNHSNSNVVDWVNNQISVCDYMIKLEKNRDSEKW